MPPRTDLTTTGSNLPTRPSAGGGPNFLATFALLIPTALGGIATAAIHSPIGIIAGAAVGLFASLSPKIARQWERAVVLRMGRYVGLKGPGVFTIVPFVDSIATWIDQRTITTSFAAEQTLTADTVPVNVDAVLFWTVHDPEKAALEVQDYVQAVSWAAQTALRDIIGRTSLTELLRGRERIEAELQSLIDERSTPWGVTVHSVEMRDVVIPAVLQDAMSREAQAAREKQARIILGQAEVEIAQLFAQASQAYEQNPTALQLRQMNILYEGLKQKGGMMVIPSSIVDSMGPAGVMGVAALANQQSSSESAPALPPGPAPSDAD
jgi:regulator of protease activity HflC (stomatin/prohibitin superfamily)